jgi:5-bromo-4-chloroindolyl phosphate hydrolysis protein
MKNQRFKKRGLTKNEKQIVASKLAESKERWQKLFAQSKSK